LGANQVHAGIQALLDMFWVADHIHVQDPCLVQPLHNTIWRNPNSGDEELGSALNNDGDQLIELTLGVIVARPP
jgi:hypothetical protein